MIWKAFCLMALVAMGSPASATLTQYNIGSIIGGTPKNETAIRTVHMADGSDIIAGYDYDLSGSNAINARMIVLKITATGTIAWQKYYEVAGKNNLVQDMIVTDDNNIVIVGTVGRNSIYLANRALISKLDASDGHTIWRKVLNDNATTPGGEMFSGVTEFIEPTSGTHYLAAVGVHDFSHNAGAALICIFDEATGNFMYDEDYYYGSKGGQYLSATTSADKKTIYICGVFTGINYGDGMVLEYRPFGTSATLGLKVWEHCYDFVQNPQLHLQDNFFTRIKRYNSTLVIMGGSLHDYCTTCGSGEFIFRVSTSGTGHNVVPITNNSAVFTNTSAYAVVDDEHIFNVQSPTGAGTWFDPLLWATGTPADAVVTEVTSLTAMTANTPVKFVNSGNPGYHSLNDMTFDGTNLALAGITSSTIFGLNDIYFVRTSTTLHSDNRDCETEDQNVAFESPTITVFTPSIVHYVFTPTFSTVTEGDLNAQIRKVCGDDPGPVPCYEKAELNVIGATAVNGDCIFNITAVVTTANTIVSYDWWVPPGIWVTTTVPTYSFTIPAGTSWPLQCKVHILNMHYDPNKNEGPCCEADLEQKLICEAVQHEGCFDPASNVIPFYMTAGCGWGFLATAIPMAGITITHYDWSIGGMTYPPHYTSLTTDNQAFSTMTMGPVIVTVTIWGIDANGQECSITVTCTVNCDDPAPPGNESGGTVGKNSGSGKMNSGEINVFPNPTTNDIVVGSVGSDIRTIQVLDFAGKKVAESDYTEGTRKVTLSMTKLPAGNYMLRINNTVSKVVTKN